MTEELTISSQDLPALYRAADAASKTAQKHYLWLFRAELVFIVIASILTSINVNTLDVKRGLAIATAIVIFLSLSATVILRMSKFDKKWYGGRALAETVKTISWRFMTASEPYISTLPSKDAANKFVSAMREVLNQIRDSDKLTLDGFGMAPQIPVKMTSVRSLSFSERLRCYIICRIQEQREWYSNKAGDNRRAAGWMLAFIVTIQLLAISAAILLIALPNSPINLGSVLVTIASTLIAWLQMKKYSELSQSYAIAAHELGMIEEQANRITTDDELSIFVADAESAVSREHTLWMARRDVFSYSRT